LPAAEFAARKIPRAKLVVYDTGGHLMVGRGREVRAAVRNFLSEADLSPTAQPSGYSQAPNE